MARENTEGAGETTKEDLRIKRRGSKEWRTGDRMKRHREGRGDGKQGRKRRNWCRETQNEGNGIIIRKGGKKEVGRHAFLQFLRF